MYICISSSTLFSLGSSKLMNDKLEHAKYPLVSPSRDQAYEQDSTRLMLTLAGLAPLPSPHLRMFLGSILYPSILS